MGLMMQPLRTLAAAALCALLTCVLVPVAAHAAPAGPPIEINAILSLTGNGAFIAGSEANALRVMEAEVNAGSGIHGRPVHFTILDDQTNPQIDVQIVNDLLSKNVPLILGPNIPAACLATGPIIEKSGPVSICLNPFGHPAAGSFQFLPFSDSFQVAAATLRFFRERGLTRIAMINATDGTGRDADQAFANAFSLPENRGLALVVQEHYAAADVSVAAQIAHIKSVNPQAIISYNTGAPFGTVLHGLHDAGVDVPIITGGGNMTFAQMQQYGQFLPSDMEFGAQLAFAPGAVGPGPLRDKQLAFVESLKKAGIRPDAGHESVWDPASLAVEIMRNIPVGAGPSAARAYLSTLHGWVGIDGVYDFIGYPQRGIGINEVLILRWDANTKTFVPFSGRGGAKK
jgi:branched-chain amino acid transport system substrate-binding protein